MRNRLLKNHALSIWILISLLAGIIVGAIAPDFAVKMHPLATIFLRMVKMIIAPLLFSTLVVGIAGHGDVKKVGRVGLKTLLYFEIVTTIALFIGLGVANFIDPGSGMKCMVNFPNLDEITQMSSIVHHNSFSDFFTGMFPTSIVQSMAEGNLLQIVIFSIFFALAICTIGQKAKPVMDLLNSVCQIMFKFTEFVMIFAPIGIFGAISYTVGSNGLIILKNYAKIIGSLYFALFIFVIFVLFLACKIAKISLRALIRAIEEPALLAFSTASSEAALPKAMEIMEKFGVPKSIVGFVMPTGYTFNLDGSTLYLAIAVIFCSQIAGVNLPIEQQLIIMFALMVTSKGIAGVPRVALIVLAGTLTSFNIPIVGIAILLGIDQLLDMGRTTVNLIGNCVATVVIARWENEFDYDKMNNYITATAEKLECRSYKDSE
jgi:proton glutamate symport protein